MFFTTMHIINLDGDSPHCVRDCLLFIQKASCHCKTKVIFITEHQEILDITIKAGILVPRTRVAVVREVTARLLSEYQQNRY